MPCELCVKDPQPKNFGTPRECAFTDAGEFTPENWNCATLSLLLDLADADRDATIYGNDESVDLVYCRGDEYEEDGYGGWFVFSRYKTRGRCSSAICVGDFFPPKPVTLARVLKIIEAYRQVKLA